MPLTIGPEDLQQPNFGTVGLIFGGGQKGRDVAC